MQARRLTLLCFVIACREPTVTPLLADNAMLVRDDGSPLQGEAGDVGAAGHTGALGARGDPGPRGSAGDGATGQPGPAGPAGDTGVIGIAGVIGPTGAAGVNGPSPVGSAGNTGAIGPTGSTGRAGDTGVSPRGAPGVDVFGDGADGDLLIDDAADPQPDLGKQYRDCTVGALGPTGYKITSGTVLRCSGVFRVPATHVLRVAHFARGGSFIDSDNTLPTFEFDGPREPHPGFARSAASNGQKGSPGRTQLAAAHAIGGGVSFNGIFRPGLIGGGGGGSSVTAEGASGGGTLTIFARMGIVVDGTLKANGSFIAAPEGDGESFGNGRPGTGGGGGGVLVLVSGDSLVIGPSGTIEARGGDGRNSDGIARGTGGGGGGGGGVIQIVTTIAPDPSTINRTFVTGGIRGASGVTGMTHLLPTEGTGGGGGASCGDGGISSSIISDMATDPGAAGNGSDGCLVFSVIADPNMVRW